MSKWVFPVFLSLSLLSAENLPIVKVVTNWNWSVATTFVDPNRNRYLLRVTTNQTPGRNFKPTKTSPHVVAHQDEFLKNRILEAYGGAGKLVWRMRLDRNEKPFFFESFENDLRKRSLRLHPDGRVDEDTRFQDGKVELEKMHYGGELGLLIRREMSTDGQRVENHHLVYEIIAGKKGAAPSARLTRLERRDMKGEILDQGRIVYGTTNFKGTALTLRTERWSRADSRVHLENRIAMDARGRRVFAWSSRGSEESYLYDAQNRLSEFILRDALTKTKRRDKTFYYFNENRIPSDLFVPPEPPALALTREWQKIPTTGELRNRLVFFRPSGLPGKEEAWSHDLPENPGTLTRKWSGETYAALAFDQNGFLKSKTIHLPGKEKSLSYTYTYESAKVDNRSETRLKEEATISENGARVRNLRYLYEKPTPLPGADPSRSPDHKVNAAAATEGEEGFYFSGRSLFDLLVSESQSLSDKEKPLTFEEDKSELLETLRYMARSGLRTMLLYNEKNRLASFVRLEVQPGKYAHQFGFSFYEPLLNFHQMRGQQKPEPAKQDAVYTTEARDLDDDQRETFEAFAKKFDQNRHKEYVRFTCRFWTDKDVKAVQNSEITAYQNGMPVAETGLTGDRLRSWRAQLPGEESIQNYFEVLARKSSGVK